MMGYYKLAADMARSLSRSYKQIDDDHTEIEEFFDSPPCEECRSHDCKHCSYVIKERGN